MEEKANEQLDEVIVLYGADDEMIKVEPIQPSSGNNQLALAHRMSQVTDDSSAQPQISTYHAISKLIWGYSSPPALPLQDAVQKVKEQKKRDEEAKQTRQKSKNPARESLNSQALTQHRMALVGASPKRPKVGTQRSPQLKKQSNLVRQRTDATELSLARSRSPLLNYAEFDGNSNINTTTFGRKGPTMGIKRGKGKQTLVKKKRKNSLAKMINGLSAGASAFEITRKGSDASELAEQTSQLRFLATHTQQRSQGQFLRKRKSSKNLGISPQNRSQIFSNNYQHNRQPATQLFQREPSSHLPPAQRTQPSQPGQKRTSSPSAKNFKSRQTIPFSAQSKQKQQSADSSESDCEVGDELVEKETRPSAQLNSYQSQQVFQKVTVSAQLNSQQSQQVFQKVAVSSQLNNKPNRLEGADTQLSFTKLQDESSELKLLDTDGDLHGRDQDSLAFDRVEALLPMSTRNKIGGGGHRRGGTGSSLISRKDSNVSSRQPKSTSLQADILQSVQSLSVIRSKYLENSKIVESGKKIHRKVLEDQVNETSNSLSRDMIVQRSNVERAGVQFAEEHDDFGHLVRRYSLTKDRTSQPIPRPALQTGQPPITRFADQSTILIECDETSRISQSRISANVSQSGLRRQQRSYSARRRTYKEQKQALNSSKAAIPDGQVLEELKCDRQDSQKKNMLTLERVVALNKISRLTSGRLSTTLQQKIFDQPESASNNLGWTGIHDVPSNEQSTIIESVRATSRRSNQPFVKADDAPRVNSAGRLLKRPKQSNSPARNHQSILKKKTPKRQSVQLDTDISPLLFPSQVSLGGRIRTSRNMPDLKPNLSGDVNTIQKLVIQKQNHQSRNLFDQHIVGGAEYKTFEHVTNSRKLHMTRKSDLTGQRGDRKLPMASKVYTSQNIGVSSLLKTRGPQPFTPRSDAMSGVKKQASMAITCTRKATPTPTRGLVKHTLRQQAPIVSGRQSRLLQKEQAIQSSRTARKDVKIGRPSGGDGFRSTFKHLSPRHSARGITSRSPGRPPLPNAALVYVPRE